MKVHRSGEVPICTEISEKATRDIELTSKMNPNDLKCILWTLSRRFWPNLMIFSHFWPKMTVRYSECITQWRTTSDRTCSRMTKWDPWRGMSLLYLYKISFQSSTTHICQESGIIHKNNIKTISFKTECSLGRVTPRVQDPQNSPLVQV